MQRRILTVRGHAGRGCRPATTTDRGNSMTHVTPFSDRPRNDLAVPEIRNYRRRVIGTKEVIRYEQRDPGATEWQFVRFERPSVPAKRAA